MFLRGVFRCLFRNLILIAAIGLSATVAGCSFIGAELNNRGGYLDKKGDEIWFIADTKPMRVLRAYVMLGSITRLAQTNYGSEREIIVQHVNSAIKVASDAYYCAFAQPGTCVYFDERMVELEISVLKLLVAVLSKKEEEELFHAVGKYISDTIPLLKTFDTLTGLVDGLTSTGELAVNASKAIASLLKAGQVFYIKGRRMGALYRDAVELQMVAVMSSLDAMCAIRHSEFTVGDGPYFKKGFHSLSNNSERTWAINNFYGELPRTLDPCESFQKGHNLWQRGAGDFSGWVDFLHGEAAKYRTWIIPDKNAFIQASDLIWRACEHLTPDQKQLSICIGRRSIEGVEDAKCAVDFDRIIVKNTSILMRDKAAKKEEAPASIADDNRCRLILYFETVEMRLRGRLPNGANARLEWLSNLTPYPSNPLAKHPGPSGRKL